MSIVDQQFRPSAGDIGEVRAQVEALRGSADGYDLAVWAAVAKAPADVDAAAGEYSDAGATWWIETAWPGPDWWPGIQARVAAGR